MTTANLRIAYNNAVDHPACVLTCGVAPTLPLDNLKNMKRNRIMRVPANPAFSIQGTYGGMGVYANMISGLRTNLEPAGIIQFQGYPNANWTGTPVDTGPFSIESATLGDLDFGVEPLGSGIFDPFYGQKNVRAFFARTLILSWTLTITDTGNSSGFIDLSRLWIGDYFELTENPEYGHIWGWIEKSETWRSDGASPHTDGAVPYRGGSFDLKYIIEADRARWMDITRYCGLGRRDVWLSARPTDTDGNLIRDYEGAFIFQGELPRFTYSEYERYDSKITLEET